jgi:hypothetical protein
VAEKREAREAWSRKKVRLGREKQEENREEGKREAEVAWGSNKEWLRRERQEKHGAGGK